MLENQLHNGNLSLSYGEREAGQIPLILLHGLTFGWRSYLPLIGELPDNIKIFALDFRGHGKSVRSPAPYNFSDLVSDTIVFLRETLGRPAHLFGHSLGGAVALAVSAEAPELIRGVIISDNFLTCESYSLAVEQPLIRHLFEGLRKIALQRSDTAKTQGLMSNLLLPVPGLPAPVRLGDFPGNSPDFLKMWAECLNNADPEIVTLLFNIENIDSFEGEEYLEQLRCPLMLLQANPDLGGLLSDQDLSIAEKIKPDLKKRFFGNSGHFMHLHNPRPTAQLICEFIWDNLAMTHPNFVPGLKN